MKRYRILEQDFDTRANILNLEIGDDWEDHIKEQWRSAKEGIKRGLLLQYGFENADAKLKNFVDLGPKPLSVVAHHNRFAEQARSAPHARHSAQAGGAGPRRGEGPGRAFRRG